MRAALGRASLRVRPSQIPRSAAVTAVIADAAVQLFQS